MDLVIMSNEWPITGEKMHGHTAEMQSGSQPKTRDKIRFVTIQHLDGRTGASRRVLVQRAGVFGAFIEDADVRWAWPADRCR